MAQSAFERATHLQAANQWDQATTHYQAWLRRHPNDSAAWLNLSHCALAQSKLEQAKQACTQASRYADTPPLQAEAAFVAGRIYRQQQHWEAARNAFAQAVDLQPNLIDAWLGLANSEVARKDYPAALNALENALNYAPTYAPAWNNLGYLLKQMGEFEAAIRCYDCALQYQPNYPQAWSNLGNARKACRDFEGAIAAHHMALQQDPSHAEAWCNLGVLYYERGDVEAAVHAYEQAWGLDPDVPYLRWNHAQALLSQGEFRRGWAYYESRWEDEINDPLPNFGCPIWQGESLYEKRLLLHSEQGLGDTLQFLRYLPLLFAQGAQVILHLRRQHGLKRLCQDSFPNLLACVVDDDIIPDCDFHCPLLSLPHVCQIPDIPQSIPYLHVPDTRQAEWAKRLGTRHGLRVGVVWAGGFRPEIPEAWLHDARRSLPLRWFDPLADLPNIEWYSLQQGNPASQLIQGLSQLPLRRDIESCHDFAETAALITNLDLVISVDTSVAHLTAALDKPLCLLSRFDACWRWLINGQLSPWYPNVTVLRQHHPDDWDSVMPTLLTTINRLANHTLDD